VDELTTSPRVTFGIVGGYGATGKVVASELWKWCNGKIGDIIIGGRDLAKARSLAATSDNRASAVHLDIFDRRSLDDFCSRCSIVVNCAGPVVALRDRVAQAAFRLRCHYIDAAGMSLVKARMLPHSREIEDAGLSFVISAGWTPGLTELLPVYADSQARTKLDTIESMTVYFSDSGEWSDNALRDAARFLHESGLSGAGYFRKGEWTRAKMSDAFRNVDLGDPVGSRRFAMYWLPEMREVGRRLKEYDFCSYTYLPGLRNAVAPALIAVFALPEKWSVRLLRNVFRGNRLAVDGFVVAHVLGRSNGRPLAMNFQIVYRDRRDYWMNGIALATASRFVAERKDVKTGVHFLADAVDPAAFMAELRKAGVEQVESMHQRADVDHK
jgi:hypothetical protein